MIAYRQYIYLLWIDLYFSHHLQEVLKFPNVHFLIYIAEEFGIKELLPAYLSPNLQPHELITGVCFASGATGYDPITPKQAVHTLSI